MLLCAKYYYDGDLVAYRKEQIPGRRIAVYCDYSELSHAEFPPNFATILILKNITHPIDLSHFSNRYAIIYLGSSLEYTHDEIREMVKLLLLNRISQLRFNEYWLDAIRSEVNITIYEEIFSMPRLNMMAVHPANSQTEKWVKWVNCDTLMNQYNTSSEILAPALIYGYGGESKRNDHTIPRRGYLTLLAILSRV